MYTVIGIACGLMVRPVLRRVLRVKPRYYGVCSYCGETTKDTYTHEPGTAEACSQMRDHIEVCPKHPLAAARAERDKLQRFKDYCHARLDAAGVPADPPSTHRAEGCRIGGRLDIVLNLYSAFTYDGPISAGTLGGTIPADATHAERWAAGCKAMGVDPDDGVVVADTQCRVPPTGWRCTRTAGHEGPCAAEPTSEGV